ncbi:hypothetical protein N781_16375 [Pontibacillus halophilus JSM 076056 = DSM 19796]|uniref:YdbS-like PH domain-containing protein n=1 Tax=Pontibacillus halophilus JSM 076056 = DSM 19796 TaxID=1385510 RepID=A0A0A5GGZ3_9BACI|nr:PH domain-containing protein [Pontibacillus halophilus]KGX92486.1 hypothetical protein N781_16375 [Pontibacillus halophilus JSM 076056 = DSM 19796]
MTRQHPFAIAQHGFKFVRNLGIFIFIAIFQDVLDGEWLFPSLFIIGWFILGALLGFLHWYFLRYDLDTEDLTVYKGVFSKKVETFPYVKISGVHYQSNPLLRLFNLTSLHIETAGNMETSASLTLKHTTAQEMENTILNYADNIELTNEEEHVVVEESPEKNTVDYRLPWSYVIVMSATSNSFYAGLILILSSLNRIYDFAFYSFGLNLPLSAEEFSYGAILALSPLFLLPILLISVLGAWVFGTIIVSLRYANFTVKRDGDKLYMSYGLWTTRHIALEVSRIQAIRIQEGIVRRWLGFNSVAFDSIGYDHSSEGLNETVLLPLVRRKETWELIQRLVPEFYVQPTLSHSPSRARIRFYNRGAFLPLLIPAVAGFFWSPLWWLLIATPFLLYLSELRFRDNGIGTVEDKIVTSSRLIQKEMVVIPWPGLQSIDRTESFFQRRRNLASYQISVATDKVSMMYNANELDPNLHPHLISFMQRD